MKVENRLKVLENRDLAVIMPYEMHEVEILEDVPYEYMVCRLPVTFVPEMISDRLKRLGTFFVWEPKIVFLDRMDDYYNQYREEGDSDVMLYLGLSSWLASILFYLARNDAPSDAAESENILVSDIKKYVEENLARRITVQDLAEKFHRSPSYIEKQFLAVTGESVMTYVRKKRLNLAEFLIKNKTRPSDVAKHLGYTDYASFYRAYVSVKGVPPAGKKINDPQECNAAVEEDAACGERAEKAEEEQKCGDGVDSSPNTRQ
ncbi:MAG: AraC family transcriptional regulator [Clostridia bacterium]|nr:AraC family transcriptional regulator [Clostridia bacterium]